MCAYRGRSKRYPCIPQPSDGARCASGILAGRATNRSSARAVTGGTSRCLERHHPFIGFNGYFRWHMNDIWMKCWLMPSDIGSKAKTDVFGNSTSMSFWESKLQRFLHPDRPQRENRWNYGGCSVYTSFFSPFNGALSCPFLLKTYEAVCSNYISMNWPIFKSTATPNIWCDFPQHAPFPWFSSLPSAYRMCAWVEMASTLRDQIPECLRWMSTSIAWVGRRNVSKPSWVTTGIPLVGWSCCTLTKKSGRWSNSHSTHRDVTRWLVREWSPHGLISAIFRLANFYIWVTHHSAERRFFGDNSAADHRRIHPVQPWDFRLLVLFRSESEASVATWNKLRFMIHCLVGSTCLFLLGPAISQVFASDLQLQSRFCLLVVGPLV